MVDLTGERVFIIAAIPSPASTTAAIPSQPYHLSADEIARFDREGYVVLKDRIPAALLARLQEAADGWIADGRGHRRPAIPATVDYHFAERDGTRRMFRVDYLPARIELRRSSCWAGPAVLGIAESLAGADFVPTYESLVFKDAGDGAAIDWHQDAVHPRTRRIFNIDVYLDASRAGEGALRVAPAPTWRRWTSASCRRSTVGMPPVSSTSSSNQVTCSCTTS